MICASCNRAPSHTSGSDDHVMGAIGQDTSWTVFSHSALGMMVWINRLGRRRILLHGEGKVIRVLNAAAPLFEP
jgi:hypothetical protein